MAKRRRGRARPEDDRGDADGGDAEQPVDPAVIGQGVGNFVTINGIPAIIEAVLVVLTLLLIRPVLRAFRAFIRQ
jgi:hypothetical protein